MGANVILQGLGEHHSFPHPFEVLSSQTCYLLHGNHKYLQISAATLPSTSAL